MLRTLGGLARSALTGVSGSSTRRAAFSSSSTGEGKPKDPSPKEVLGDELLNAVDAVASELHGTDKDAGKGMKSSLLSRLISHEKATFEAATTDHTTEMLSDPSVVAVLKEASTPSRALPKAIEDRKTRRGLVLLRKEVFYQAKQSGYNAEEARRISEEAVDEADDRLKERREGEKEKKENEVIEERIHKEQRNEKENKLYDLAYQMAEKMLYGAESPAAKLTAMYAKVLEPDAAAPNFLSSEKRLNVFNDPSKLKERRIGLWEDWELEAARTWNDNIGPSNAFEEQIEWTKKGKQWPFPVDNEYLLGEESEIPFYEHIFVDKRLASSNLPKEGPIAHFMHLVAVGLSKNCHMTAAKKAEHIDWFISFFNEEKQRLVHKLHEQEQAAAANW